LTAREITCETSTLLQKETTMTSSADVRLSRLHSATGVLLCALSLGLGAVTSPVHAQARSATVIYPAKGQSTKQQDQDRYECYDWSKAQSGFDPAQVSEPAAMPQTKGSAGTAGGMVVGAAGGAAVAELTHHDAGRGAAAGALGGGLMARAKERQATQAAQQQAAQQQNARGQQKAVYDRAFGACMEARGYVVK